MLHANLISVVLLYHLALVSHNCWILQNLFSLFQWRLKSFRKSKFYTVKMSNPIDIGTWTPWYYDLSTWNIVKLYHHYEILWIQNIFYKLWKVFLQTIWFDLIYCYHFLSISFKCCVSIKLHAHCIKLEEYSDHFLDMKSFFWLKRLLIIIKACE